jgi:dTDP-4-dehydrorhamnose reductase
MKIAITGVTGRLGGALARCYRALGHEVLALDRTALDLRHPEQVSERLEKLHFDVLINPAAMTSLEACEDAPEEAQAVNAESPARMASFCQQTGRGLIHVSTDYVFGGGISKALTESDSAEPINHYGRTKLAGEKGVFAAHPEAWVARVSWVFGPEKPSFIETMLSRYANGEALAVIDDKYSCPTYTDDAAQAFLHLLSVESTHRGGVVHICNPGPVSWFDYAAEIFRQTLPAEKQPELKRLKLAEMRAFRAARPVHTAMDPTQLAQRYGFRMRPWQEALAAYLGSQGHSVTR